MSNFFAVWRVIADWLTRKLLIIFGAMCLIGALQAWKLKGEPAIVAVFALFGVALIISSYLPEKRKKS